jgi:hypothetical protein
VPFAGEGDFLSISLRGLAVFAHHGAGIRNQIPSFPPIKKDNFFPRSAEVTSFVPEPSPASSKYFLSALCASLRFVQPFGQLDSDLLRGAHPDVRRQKTEGQGSEKRPCFHCGTSDRIT